MDPVSALKSGTAAVSLVSALAKLVKESKSKQDKTPLIELLSRLQIEAARLSRDLEHRLRGLVERSSDYGLNPAQTLDQHLANLGWYNVLTRSRLKSFREECNSVYRQMTSFLDDATALMLCTADQQIAAAAFQESLQTKRELDALFLDRTLPIGRLLDGMLGVASRVSADLHTA